MAGIVIAGAGECGARAALACRDRGYEGPVTLIGEEPHEPYERPPLSKDIEDGRVRIKTVLSAGLAAEKGITLRLGATVRAIERDRRRVVLDDGTLDYDRLILATGARPRPLPLAAGAPVLMLRTIGDAEAILGGLGPGIHLAVIGAGFIGLELAATARRLGASVTVLEALPRIMARAVLPGIAAAVAERHLAEGVDLRCAVQIEAIAADLTVTLTGGAVIRPDRLVVGIGAVPETALAEAAGLAINNGIAVDRRLCTSDPAIFAAGDCCSFPYVLDGRRIRLESWRNAQDMGAVAAANALGAEEDFRAIPWFWSDQYDLTLQVAGLPDPASPAIRRDLGDGAFILFQQAGDGRLVSASGLGTGNVVAKDIRLAEMLIAAGAAPEAAALADPGVNLKKLLRSQA